MTHRVRGCARQIKGLSQNTIEFKTFIALTNDIEYFRNLFQHLNSEIPKTSGKTNPVMGALSWVSDADPNLSYSIAPGIGEYHTLAIDSTDISYASNFHFSAGNRDIDLTKTRDHCRRFEEHLSAWLRSSGMTERQLQKAGILRLHLRTAPSAEMAGAVSSFAVARGIDMSKSNEGI